MELAANKVKNDRIHERAAGVNWWIYNKALLFDIDNNKKKTGDFVTIIMPLL